MSNDNVKKSSLDESAKVLQEFIEAVGKKEMGKKGGSNLIIDNTKDALGKIDLLKNIKYLKEFLNPKILDDDEYIKKVEQNKSDIELNLHDSLGMLIYLYNSACESDTSTFDTDKLAEVRKALDHQINVFKRVDNFVSGVGLLTPCVCDQRPRTCAVCGRLVPGGYPR